MLAEVREVHHEVRITLTDAPKVTVLGRTRKPRGLRITYGLRSDVRRVDLVIEYRDDAQLWPPSQELPEWIRQRIEKHRPADVSAPDPSRREGLGSLAFPEAEEHCEALAETDPDKLRAELIQGAAVNRIEAIDRRKARQEASGEH